MATSQIAIAPDIFDRARERAAKLGVSVAEYVQRLVARDLGEPGAKVDPLVVFNLGSSGGADVAQHKDGMIREAIEADRRQDPGSR